MLRTPIAALGVGSLFALRISYCEAPSTLKGKADPYGGIVCNENELKGNVEVTLNRPIPSANELSANDVLTELVPCSRYFCELVRFHRFLGRIIGFLGHIGGSGARAG